MVDIVLPCQGLADEICRIAGATPPPALEDPPAAGSIDRVQEEQLQRIFAMLRSASGVDFRHYKMPTISRRLQRRLVLHKLTRLEDYVRLMRENPEEVLALYRHILIHVTRFFREATSFDALVEQVFPRLIEEHHDDLPIRAWVAGCSTGEEAYSLAIRLLECLGDRAGEVPMQIFATDVSEEAIQQARTGLYPPSIAADVSPERLRRFFNKVDGGYRITGKWGFASGVLDATWLLMGAACYDETGTRTSDASYALVPISQIKVYDDWNTMGLSGTASHSVEVKDVFVPDHRILDPVAASSGSYPSDYAHERPLYRSAFLPVVAVVLVPPALGAARAMLETFIAQVPKRRIAYTTYDKQIESVVTQTKLAEAAILIDEAQYHLERCCADIDRWAETKDYMDYDGRVRGRVDIGRALDLCRDAANLLLSISGGAGIASANPLQRYFREIHSCTVHALLLPTVQYEIYGKHLLHQPQITPFI